MTRVLETQALSAGYAGYPIVHDLDLHVDAGEVVALLGPNGAGKTTALLTMAGDLTPLGGEVRFDGQPVVGPMSARAKAGMALVCDDRGIFRNLTVAENLRLGDGDKAEVIRLFPTLERLLDRRAGLLSGGEQQMLGLGRALARHPKLLLADELSLGLAPIIVRDLLAAVRAEADRGGAVILIEQQARLVLGICDRAYLLNRGRIEMSGSAAEMTTRFAEIERKYLAASDS